jgi:ERCC4-type nuclease
MKVIIDEREHDLFEKCYSIVNTEGNTTFIQLSKEVLHLGDILIKTDEDKEILIIERKSFPDLFASIKDGRYEEQSYRLLNSSNVLPHNILYLLEGMFSQLKSITEKKLVYSTIASLNFMKGFSVMRTATVRESAELIIWMANKIERDFHKGKIPYYLVKQSLPLLNNENNMIEEPKTEPANQVLSTTNSVVTNADYCNVVKKVKKDNVTPENIGEIILCQIPGISSKTAITIMKPFLSFPHFLEELQKNNNILENITMENEGKQRKINKSCIENIKKYLLKVI